MQNFEDNTDLRGLEFSQIVFVANGSFVMRKKTSSGLT